MQQMTMRGLAARAALELAQEPERLVEMAQQEEQRVAQELGRAQQVVQVLRRLVELLRGPAGRQERVQVRRELQQQVLLALGLELVPNRRGPRRGAKTSRQATRSSSKGSGATARRARSRKHS